MWGFGVIGYQIVTTHQVAHALERGFSAVTLGWVFGLGGACTVAGNVIGGALSDRWGREWVFALGSAIGIAGHRLSRLARRPRRPPAPARLRGGRGGLRYAHFPAGGHPDRPLRGTASGSHSRGRPGRRRTRRLHRAVPRRLALRRHRQLSDRVRRRRARHRRVRRGRVGRGSRAELGRRGAPPAGSLRDAGRSAAPHARSDTTDADVSLGVPRAALRQRAAGLLHPPGPGRGHPRFTGGIRPERGRTRAPHLTVPLALCPDATPGGCPHRRLWPTPNGHRLPGRRRGWAGAVRLCPHLSRGAHRTSPDRPRGLGPLRRRRQDHGAVVPQPGVWHPHRSLDVGRQPGWADRGCTTHGADHAGGLAVQPGRGWTGHAGDGAPDIRLRPRQPLGAGAPLARRHRWPAAASGSQPVDAAWARAFSWYCANQIPGCLGATPSCSSAR